MSALAVSKIGAALRVRVTPRAARDGADGLGYGAEGRGHLALRVRAAPADGAANKAVIALVAALFELPKSAVSLETGATRRLKRLALTGDPEAIARRYAKLIG